MNDQDGKVLKQRPPRASGLLLIATVLVVVAGISAALYHRQLSAPAATMVEVTAASGNGSGATKTVVIKGLPVPVGADLSDCPMPTTRTVFDGASMNCKPGGKKSSMFVRDANSGKTVIRGCNCGRAKYKRTSVVGGVS